MNTDTLNKIDELCSFVCNGKTYKYEQKLIKATENELYDAAIIYAWNIFMLFVYERVWQIRELEKLDESIRFQTDKKAFLTKINPKIPDKFPDDYLDGHLCNLNKLHAEQKGEEFIVGRLVDVYPGMDQQYFKKAQKILKSRHDGAHINEIQQDCNDLENVLRELIQVAEKVQEAHNQHLQSIFENLDVDKQWHLSEQDFEYIGRLFEQDDTEKSKYIYISKLVFEQELSKEMIKKIKERAIKYFLKATSFKEANNFAYEIIRPMLSYFNVSDVTNILEGVFDKQNGRRYNQVLNASKMPEFFLELYQLSSNNFPSLAIDWDMFVINLKDKGFEGAYAELIEVVNA